MAWFNRLSPDGLHWVGEEDSQIQVDGTVVALDGIQSCWLNSETILFSSTLGACLYSLNLRTKEVAQYLLPAPCNWLEANTNGWMAWMPTIPAYSLSGQLVRSEVCPGLRPDGTAFLPPAEAIRPRSTPGGEAAIFYGPEGPYVVPEHWAPWRPKTHGAIPVMTPEGSWILRVEDDRLVLHPAGSRKGIVVSTNETHHPDCVWCPQENGIAVVYTAENTPGIRNGTTVRRLVRLTDARVDLILAPIPPIEPPVVDPSPMPNAPNFLPVIEDLAVKHPLIFAAAHRPELGEAAWEFIHIAATELHKIDPRFGLNGKRGGDELSMDAVAYKSDTPLAARAGGVEIIDIIAAAGSSDARPTWSDVTQATVDAGTVGKWIQPRGVVNPPSEPTNPPIFDSNELVKQLVSRLVLMEGRLTAISLKQEALIQQLATAEERLTDAIVSQAQAVARTSVVTSERVIARIDEGVKIKKLW